MNAAGREVLIAAGLRGHPQAYGRMHQHVTLDDVFTLPLRRLFRRATWQGAECAAGVLHLSVHASRAEALICPREPAGQAVHGPSPVCPWREVYALSADDFERLVMLNDMERLDFIGIARKLDEEGAA